MRTLSVIIPAGMSRKTVKAVLRQELKMANGLIARVKLREQGIMLNGERVHTDRVVHTGDILTVEVGDLPRKEPVKPVPLPLTFLYEDDDLLILDKPAGLAVHGAMGEGRPPTLLNALAAYLGPRKVIHPVNRLDKGTSGLMTVAKNSYMHDRLRTLLHKGEFYREYRGIIRGRLIPPAGLIDLPVGRTPDSIIKRCIDPAGSPALTRYETLQTAGGLTLLRLMPQTGRTHQLRLHLSAIGHPLVGDWLYGTEEPALISRPALHSCYLKLVHPVSGKTIEVSAPLPEDMARLLE